VTVPFKGNAKEQLAQVLREAYVESEARSIWFAFPSLRTAAEQTLEMLTLAWPALGIQGKSAVALAVLTALSRVRRGLEDRENTTDLVVRNFLTGLATVAESVARTQAWGFKEGRSIEQYDHNRWDFATWSHRGDFDEVKFFVRSDVSKVDQNGTRLKFLCKVADSRYVGLVDLYK
jgi:hypothetical protein